MDIIDILYVVISTTTAGGCLAPRADGKSERVPKPILRVISKPEVRISRRQLEDSLSRHKPAFVARYRVPSREKTSPSSSPHETGCLDSFKLGFRVPSKDGSGTYPTPKHVRKEMKRDEE